MFNGRVVGEIRYAGPTATKGARIIMCVHGRMRNYVDRDYSTSYAEQVKRDCVEFYQELFDTPNIVLYIKDDNPDVYYVIVQED